MQYNAQAEETNNNYKNTNIDKVTNEQSKINTNNNYSTSTNIFESKYKLFLYN